MDPSMPPSSQPNPVFSDEVLQAWSKLMVIRQELAQLRTRLLAACGPNPFEGSGVGSQYPSMYPSVNPSMPPTFESQLQVGFLDSITQATLDEMESLRLQVAQLQIAQPPAQLVVPDPRPFSVQYCNICAREHDMPQPSASVPNPHSPSDVLLGVEAQRSSIDTSLPPTSPSQPPVERVTWEMVAALRRRIDELPDTPTDTPPHLDTPLPAVLDPEAEPTHRPSIGPSMPPTSPSLPGAESFDKMSQEELEELRRALKDVPETLDTSLPAVLDPEAESPANVHQKPEPEQNEQELTPEEEEAALV